MKAVKIIVLVAVIAAICIFWIVPESKKLAVSYRELQWIKSMNQQMEDGDTKIVPNNGWPITQ